MALSKYQEVAKRIKTLLETKIFNLDMDFYYINKLDNMEDMPDEENASIGIEHICNTSFCLAGALAYEDKYPSEYLELSGIKMEFNYRKYSMGLIRDIGPLRVEKWDFLFSHCWSNSVNQAIKRCKYVIEHDENPPREEWGEFGWTDKEIIWL